jgi:hypothetical protein
MAYDRALESATLSRKCRMEFIVCLSVLVRMGLKWNTNQYKEWFAENAADEDYFEETVVIL